MVTEEGSFFAKFNAWAAAEKSVRAVVLIGSRVRTADDEVWAADAQSDWDFQIITSKPGMFADAGWTGAMGLRPRVYVPRTAAIGGVPKVAALFEETEVDFVILPAAKMRLAKISLAMGLHRAHGRVQRSFQDLAVVIRPGWRFLKGGETWDGFYRRIVAEVADRRLSDAGARLLADGFVCDLVWTLRKIERGEFLAAQRMLHHSLMETNFRLLHELRLRRGGRTFPEARRIERVAAPLELEGFMFTVAPDAPALRAATERSAGMLRHLMQELVGNGWRWPL